MSIKIAVAGLKHNHVHGVLRAISESTSMSIVGVAEDSEENRRVYQKLFGLNIQYSNHKQLLDSVKFDVLVVCEEFSQRGKVIIDALREGKHVFSDKPLCIREQELREIASLLKKKDLEIGLDWSYRHQLVSIGSALQQGEIGEIISCAFFSPHALNYETRPRWYFEPGKHGGIINDLIGHGLDYIRWVCGKEITHVLSATRSCMGFPQESEFETLGQVHYQMESSTTVFGQVDYLVPVGHPAAWRLFFVGTEGDAIIDERGGIVLRRSGKMEQKFEAGASKPQWKHPFIDFIHFLHTGEEPLRMTDDVLRCSLAALVAQFAAETGKTSVPIRQISKQ